MLKSVTLVTLFVCFASSKFLINTEILISYQINGVEVEQTFVSRVDIPPPPNDTENVLYKFGKRESGDRRLTWSYSDQPEGSQITKVNNTMRIPAEGNDSVCVFRAMELLIGQRPNVDQSVRVLEGGFGQRYLHFEHIYQNMTRSFSYMILYGKCDND